MRLVAAYAWLAGALLAIGLAVPVEAGPLAIVELLAPYAALVCALGIPIALATRSRSLAVPVAITALLFLARFGGEWTSPAAPADVPDMRVATWNLQAGVNAGASAVAMLRERPVDIVALQELTGDVAAAIESDAQLTAGYPYRALEARLLASGAGILSRYPIASAVYTTDPVRLEAHVRLPDREIVVIDAHPFRADLEVAGGLPVGMDPTERDRALLLLRERVAELEAAGSEVLLMGDFNTAPTEPAFDALAAGLHDVHRDVGWGPGWTWRPSGLEFLGIGLLRIDRVLSTPGLTPVGTNVVCPRAGDHCLLEAALAFEDG